MTEVLASLSVLVVDDHPLFRQGFVGAWRRERQADRVLEAGGIEDAIDMLNRQHVDLAVVDVILPDGVGLELCRVAAERGGVSVVILSTYDAAAVVHAARACGAVAFFPKDTDVNVLLSDVTRIMRGELRERFPAVPALPPLTPRERRVLGSLLDGATNPEIAEHFGVSVETAKTHVGSVMMKLGVSDRFAAAAVARSWGYDIALPYLGDA